MDYQVINKETGRIIATFPGVLQPVRLSACTATNGSNVLQVDAVTTLHVGMGVSCQTFPRGCFIAAIKDTNEIVLARSAWNATTKEWETSEDLAQSDGGGSSLTAVFHGFSGVPVCDLFAMGTYRDRVTATTLGQLVAGSGSSWTSAGQLSMAGAGYYVDQPVAAMVTSGAANTTPLTFTGTLKLALDDEAGHVSPRHKCEPWSSWLFIGESGHLGRFPASDLFAVVPVASAA
jgi:hypothetical protein